MNEPEQLERLLSAFDQEAHDDIWYSHQYIRKCASWSQVGDMNTALRSRFASHIIERLRRTAPELEKHVAVQAAHIMDRVFRPWHISLATLSELGRMPLGLCVTDLETLIQVSEPFSAAWNFTDEVPSLVVRQLQGRCDIVTSSQTIRLFLRKHAYGLRNEGRSEKQLAAVFELLGEKLPVLDEDEVWADAALEDIAALSTDKQSAWNVLLGLCRSSGTSLTSKFRKSAAPHLAAIGTTNFVICCVKWFALVDKPRPVLRAAQHQWDRVSNMEIVRPHMEVLKALAWIAGDIAHPELARALGQLAFSTYKKIPGKGPRAIKVGNACITALGSMPGRDSLAQLAMLKVKVKFIPAQKGIEKALTAAAEREGLPRSEIEELAVPSYGLTDVGVLEEPMGDFTARFTIRGVGDSELMFVRKDGKLAKSVPAAVKASHAQELKELKLAMKDIGTMLPAQKDRIDSMFLDDKSWTIPIWRERYLDHPLVGVLARKLIWSVRESEKAPWRSVTWLKDTLVDIRGEAIKIGNNGGTVRLWHPIGMAEAEVLEWRRFFEDREIRQPFKQAHREVYLLTDAERRTSTYSNRFAAHVIKQHQFHALAALRGWRNKLRLMVDADYEPPFRRLERWGLRAEYWIEGAGDEYGTDTNEVGSFLRLVTDQVRFYRIEAPTPRAHASGGGYNSGASAWEGGNTIDDEPILLDTVPALVFSEIMRDVDLFVGVCSVANNPQWQDGGPNNRYRDYWWQVGFGDLSRSATTRRDLLTRLLPRLKIAKVCSLSDKFLVVKGTLRTYKIHLGSGNIMMEPNDQYLCIVPTSRDENSSAGIALPFEGDRVLSIILSKAFLLAEDDKIKDQTIVSQIKRA